MTDNPAGRLALIAELTKQAEPCVCERCGNEHQTEPGLLAHLSPEEIRALLDGPKTV